jgi:ankyrin repeat protein
MIACSSGAIDVVKEYLRVNANLKAKDENGMTALHHASANGYNKIVPLLLSHQAALTSNENISLIVDHQETVVQTLLNTSTADPLKKTTPLHLAVENGHTKVIEILLNHSSYDSSLADGENRTALHLAVKNNNLDIVELLLSTNIPINACIDTGNPNVLLHVISRSWCGGIMSKKFQCRTAKF